jgi:hypothetical protein
MSDKIIASRSRLSNLDWNENQSTGGNTLRLGRLENSQLHSQKGEPYEEPKKTSSVFHAVVCLRDSRDRRRSSSSMRAR